MDLITCIYSIKSHYISISKNEIHTHIELILIWQKKKKMPPHLDIGRTGDAVDVVGAEGRVWVEGVRLPAAKAVAHAAGQVLQRGP